MPVKITPLSCISEIYIIPYARKSENYELCLKFEMEHITLQTYECVKSFLEEKGLGSKEFGYIITNKFNYESEYKNISSYKAQNGKDECIIHRIII